MEWVHTLTIIGVMIAGFGLIWNLFSKLDNDVNRLSSRMDGHAQRIDQLYLSWVQERKDFDAKFYQLLKEIQDKRKD